MTVTVKPLNGFWIKEYKLKQNITQEPSNGNARYNIRR